MTRHMSEKPGAQTPWPTINQLLLPDERFEVQGPHWKGFLLAPKHSSQLAALFYLLHQQGIAFCVQGRGTTTSDPQSYHSVIVSARAFSQLFLHDQEGILEAGAGCSLSHLHQFLFERQQEIALEEDPLASPKRSLAGLLLSGKVMGIPYRQENLSATILGIEWVTWEGCQITWGGCQRSALAGPAMHKLIVGLHSLPGMIVKTILKTYPVPQARLQLAWAFREKEALWEHVESLKEFSSTWECLDCVQSGQSTDQGFVFAQIAGFQEEMEAFRHFCPRYSMARQRNERLALRNFLKQQKLHSESTSFDQWLEPGEYLWYHALHQQGWWMTSKCLEKKLDSQPIWKQRLLYSVQLKAGSHE